MENKYIRGSHINEAKFRQIIMCFVLDLTATQTAEITSLNRKTVDRLYSLIRARINEYTKETSPLKGEIESDKSFFAPKRTRGSAAEEPEIKQLCLASSNGTEKYIRKSFQTVQPRRCKGLSEVMSISIPLFIPMVGEDTMAFLMSVMKNIIVLSMAKMSFQKVMDNT